MNTKILFEDDFLLVVDKPAGIVVNRAETTARVETVQDWVEKHNPVIANPTTVEAKPSHINNEIATSPAAPRNDIAREFYSRSGIVHRLDKDTSGLLVIAKTPEAFENLKGQFKNRTVTKKYLALVHGKVEPEDGIINAPIERSPFNRKHFGVFPGGRSATTEYKSLKSLKSLTLLELTPHTGRTHQIRVHMKYINHPIVSDPIYGGRKNLQADLKFCPRLFLHAAFLRIKHPTTDEVAEFVSPLPVDLETCLSSHLAPI